MTSKIRFECDMNRFSFCFDFVRSHAPRGCYSIVCLRFQVSNKTG